MSERREKQERRTSRERRKARIRQRNGGEVTAVVEIAQQDLRLAVLQQSADDRSDRVKSDIVTWNLEGSPLNSESGVDDLSRALVKLVDQNDLQDANFHFVLGGELCVTKSVRGTTEQVRDELRQIEERSQLYLSLGTGEKVVATNSRSLDARHRCAVASVCNHKTLETLQIAAGRAGIQIDSIEPALVSLCRVIGRLEDVPDEPCLIVHCDHKVAKVGVCFQGQLMLDYRPGGHSCSEGIARLVHSHLNRLQRHCDRTLKKSLPSIRRVYFCGEREAVQQSMSAFAEFEKFDVKEIHPSAIQASWQLKEGVERSSLVPALGNLLRTYLPREEDDAPNFMQHVIDRAREPMRPIVIRSLLPMAAVLLIGFFGWLFNIHLQTSVNELQAQLDELQPARTRHRELRLELTSAEVKRIQLERLVESLPSIAVGDIPERIGHCMPSDVWLRNMAIENMTTVTLTGSSFLEAGVFDFVRWLEQAPGFIDVALHSTRASRSHSGSTIDFDVELNFSDTVDPVPEVARNE